MKNSITGVLFLLTAIAVFWLWTMPAIDTIKVLQADKQSFDDVLARSREVLVTRDKLVAQFNSVSPGDLDRFYKIIPDKPESERLMVEFADVAEAAGGLVKEFRNTESKGLMEMTVSFHGSYDSFRSFLGELQQSLRLLDVDYIKFAATEANVYEFSIKVNSYYQFHNEE